MQKPFQIAQRTCTFGAYHRISADPTPGAQPYVIAGRRLYVLGYASGELGPIGAEHLVGQMGGIWCHPVRVGDGIGVTVAPTAATAEPHSATFSEDLASVAWEWSVGPFAVRRRDYALPADPGLVCRISVSNPTNAPHDGELRFTLPLSFTGAWFSGIPSGHAAYHLAHNLLLGQDGIQTHWSIASAQPRRRHPVASRRVWPTRSLN